MNSQETLVIVSLASLVVVFSSVVLGTYIKFKAEQWQS
jgi:hypothetical protein